MQPNISAGFRRRPRESSRFRRKNVQVISDYAGGGFGCKGEDWSHVILAAARPRTHQHMTLGATFPGKLTAIQHDVHCNTSVIEDYLESSVFPTRVMYACPNMSTTSRMVQLNLGTPTYMRAPGVVTGT